MRAVVEYDGLWHNDSARFHRNRQRLNRQRLNRLLNTGWLVLHVTAKRLHIDFAGALRKRR